MSHRLGIDLTDIFETHVFTTNLPRAMDFYGTTLGLELAHHIAERAVAFYWIGAPGHAMLGVWGAPPERWQRSHVAFTIGEQQIEDALDSMRRAGAHILDFFGEPTEDPSVHPWMPACGIFFRDPDGNSLELLAMLSDAPRPDLTTMPLSVWRTKHARGAAAATP